MCVGDGELPGSPGRPLPKQEEKKNGQRGGENSSGEGQALFLFSVFVFAHVCSHVHM